MKQFSKREKMVLALCVVICFLFIGKQVLVPFFSDYGYDLESGIKSTGHRIAEARAVIALNDGNEKRLADLAALIGSAKSEGADISRFVSRMDEVSRLAKVRIITVQPKGSRRDTAYVRYFVEAAIEGDWKSVARFTFLLQAGEDSLNIEEMRLEKYSEDTALLHGRLVFSWIRLVE